MSRPFLVLLLGAYGAAAARAGTEGFRGSVGRWSESEGGRQRCGLGKFRLPSSDACSQCPPGKFAGRLTRIMDPGKDTCMTCPAERVASADRKRCMRTCPRGSHRVSFVVQDPTTRGMAHRAVKHVGACEQCPAGQHTTPPWQAYGPAGAVRSPCTLCAMGRFAHKPGAAMCRACPSGKQALRNGAHSCPARKRLNRVGTAREATTWMQANGKAAGGLGALFVAFACAITLAPRAPVGQGAGTGGGAQVAHADTTSEEAPMMATPRAGGLLPANMGSAGRNLVSDAAI